MWDRALLKQEAKSRLKRYYWMAFVVCLITSCIVGSVENSSSINFNAIFDGVSSRTAIFVLLILFLLLFLFSLAFTIFVGNPVRVGSNRYFMENRSFPGKFERLFFAFTNGGANYKNIVFTVFLRDLKVFLWSLLLIVPGIIKSYEYAMVPYLLSERPDMPPQRAFELSRKMTDGEKMEMFVLDLSFIGWYLLGTLACCIGVLFVNPYYEATHAELYAALREKAFGLGFADQSELIGFAPGQTFKQ